MDAGDNLPLAPNMAPEKSTAEKRLSGLAAHLTSSSEGAPNAVYAAVSPPPPGSVPFSKRLAEIAQRQSLSRNLDEKDPGIVRQRAQGKKTHRERIAFLLDKGSFREHGSIAGSTTYSHDDPELLLKFQRANHICGRGAINRRPVVVGADDFSVRGGHADGAIWRKATYTEGLARELRCPLIRLVDGSSGGGSVATILKTGHSYIPGYAN